MISTIEARRLYLRELRAADCSQTYLDWLADPEINRFLETRHTTHDAEAIMAFVEGVRARTDEYLFGIFQLDGNRHIGNIKVGPIHPLHCVADVSLLIGERDCWGKGYAAEAIAALSHHAFTELGIAKLSASMYAFNVGSRRAFLKAGYRDEGLRRAHYDLNGERCDLCELGLVPSDVVETP